VSFPTGLTLVEVRGVYVRVDGAAARGVVTLTPLTTKDSPGLDLTVVAASIRVNLDGMGGFAQEVVAGDDPDLGTSYLKVEEQIDGESRSYTILVPESAAETGLHLSDAEKLEPVPDMAGYVLVSSVGVAVAPLVDGLVPSVHLPPGLEGGLSSSGALSAPALAGEIFTVTVTSDWGLTSAGAYYDSDGAVPEEAAIASLDSNGSLVLTRPGG